MFQDDIASVAVGQSVAISSATGDASKGEVSLIAMLPTSSGSSATYTVTVAVTTPGTGLAVGTAASLVITVAAAEDATLVPISAVALTGTSTGTVKVLDGDSTATREIAVGIRGTTHVEVTDGLSAGDQVVLSGLSTAIPTSTSSGNAQSGAIGGSGGGMGESGMSGAGGNGGAPGGGTPPR